VPRRRAWRVCRARPEDEEMFDADHPLVRRLIDQGFRVAAHFYANRGGLRCQVSAHDGKKAFKGNSPRGDLAEALKNLAREASVAARDE
jgi:hypothetical protein